MKKQITLSLFNDELAEVKTKKKEFLEQIDNIIPWSEWINIITPFYYKGIKGNKPFPLEIMLRIYLLQNLYNLSDMGAKYEVIDSRSFSEFCCVDSSNQVPDGDTIGRFRGLLTKHGLQEKLFHQVIRLLENRGLILKKGTIVDSTIISAPSSTKNKERKRDSDAHQTKKGGNWYFGYKAHIGVDKDTGIVHHLEVTSANVHDVTVMPKLLSGEENAVYGDSGYLGADKREGAKKYNAKGKKITYKINRRPSQSKNLQIRSRGQIKRREREKSRIRAKVEHIFGIVKSQLGFRKTRYKGQEKQKAKLNMMIAIANLIIADRNYLQA